MPAVDDLKALFSRRLASSPALPHYEGNDWWQLSPAQAEVFGIELEDMPALVLAWELYEAVADIAHNQFHDTDLSRALQIEMPWIERRHCNPEAWGRFAALLGIRSGRAFQWFWKNHFECENTWVLRRDDDDLPMPRPLMRVVAERSEEPRHDHVVPKHDFDDGIPF